MSLMAYLVTNSRMQQCSNIPIDSYHEFLLLFYCCVLLEIKFTTNTTTDTILFKKMAASENFYSDNGLVPNRYQAIIKEENDKSNNV